MIGLAINEAYSALWRYRIGEEPFMFMIQWSREQLDRAIETFIRASEFMEQRAFEIAARHDVTSCATSEAMRKKSRIAAADASILQLIGREGEKHIIRATCAECRISLTVVSADGVRIEIAPHECIVMPRA